MEKEIKNERQALPKQRILETIASGFSYLGYATFDKEGEDTAVSYKESAWLQEKIPAWKEANLTKKLSLLTQHLIYEPDKEVFRAETCLGYLLPKLMETSVITISFRILDEIDLKYYQMSFFRDMDENGNFAGVIFGLQLADKEIQKQIEAKEHAMSQNSFLQEKLSFLEDTLSRAELANHTKSAFLFNMSHDIRTPMNTIIGFTRMAKKNFNDLEKLSDCLEKVSLASKHILQLLNDVLEMARIEDGKLTLDEALGSLLDCQQAMQDMIQPLADKKQITFVQDYSKVQENGIYMDKMRLDQILINLLGNAIKYTPAGGRVECTCEQIQSSREGFARFRFRISDNGIGMSKDFLGKLKKSFFDSNTAPVSGSKGLGLGMSIVKQLLDLMGGSIEFTSELAKGTTVTFEIELRMVESHSLPPEEPETLPDFTGMHVLIVDDNALNREIAREILDEFHVTADEADDGTTALEIMAQAKEGQYDLILMDVQMTHLDGYTATREIRKMENRKIAETPVIALTANVFDTDKEESRKAGMNDHLEKPIDIENLSEILKKYSK